MSLELHCFDLVRAMSYSFVHMYTTDIRECLHITSTIKREHSCIKMLGYLSYYIQQAELILYKRKSIENSLYKVRDSEVRNGDPLIVLMYNLFVREKLSRDLIRIFPGYFGREVDTLNYNPCNISFKRNGLFNDHLYSDEGIVIPWATLDIPYIHLAMCYGRLTRGDDIFVKVMVPLEKISVGFCSAWDVKGRMFLRSNRLALNLRLTITEFRNGGRFSVRVDHCQFQNEFNCIFVTQSSWFPTWLIRNIINDAILSVKDQVALTLQSKIQQQLIELLKDSNDIDITLKEQNALIFNVIYFIAYIGNCSRNEVICYIWGILVQAVEDPRIESLVMKYSDSVTEIKLFCSFLFDAVDFGYFALCGATTVGEIATQVSPPFFLMVSILGCASFDEVVDVYWSYGAYYVLQNVLYFAPQIFFVSPDSYHVCGFLGPRLACWPEWLVSHTWIIRFAFYVVSHHCPRNGVTRYLTRIAVVGTMYWFSFSLFLLMWSLFPLKANFFFYTIIPRNFLALTLVGAFYHTFLRNQKRALEKEKMSLWVAGAAVWICHFWHSANEAYILYLLTSFVLALVFINNSKCLLTLRFLQELEIHSLFGILSTFTAGYGFGCITGFLVGSLAVWLINRYSFRATGKVVVNRKRGIRT